MTIEEAQAQARSLNAQEELKRRAEQRLVIDAKKAEQTLVFDAFINPMDKAEFERKYLFQAVPEAARARHKNNSYWQAAQSAIATLQLDTEEWSEMKRTFYAYFAEKTISPSYARKIMAVLNLWGAFQARKYRKMYLPIPHPRGRDASMIADAYFERSGGGQASHALTPELLETARSNLKPEQYHWLYLTVWLGLRPEEADSVKDLKCTKVVGNVVHVYQSKLTSIPRAERWKVVPIREPEQKLCLDIIASLPIHRPLNKTIGKYAKDEKITGYGGRKNFTDLMLDRGHRLEDISQWMGHHSIDRTWRSYKNRQRLRNVA